MNQLAHLLAIMATTDFDENTVTPTWVGFLVTFALVPITVLLVWDMVRRIRRTRYRSEVREQLEAERADAQASSDVQASAEADTDDPA